MHRSEYKYYIQNNKMIASKEMQVSILLMGAEDHKNQSKAAHLSRKQRTGTYTLLGVKRREINKSDSKTNI